MNANRVTHKQSYHDLKLHALKIARAASRHAENADFLVKYIGQDFAHRINAFNREFSNAYDCFSLSNGLYDRISKLENVKQLQRIENTNVAKTIHSTSNADPPIYSSWPQNADLIISALGIHWQGELEFTLTQLFQAMKTDGLLLTAIPAKGTLAELGDSLTLAELEIRDGAAMRVDPFLVLSDIGSILQSVGFRLPVIDREQVIVRYDNMQKLIDDLRSMAATSCFRERSEYISRATFRKAAEIYAEKYCDPDGRIRATFNFAYITAWTPHKDQQQPLKPGSAKHKLTDALRTLKE